MRAAAAAAAAATAASAAAAGPAAAREARVAPAARRFLTAQYLAFKLRRHIAAAPAAARRGGAPDVRADVCANVRLVVGAAALAAGGGGGGGSALAARPLPPSLAAGPLGDDGLPLWAVAFYALLAGAVRVAADAVAAAVGGAGLGLAGPAAARLPAALCLAGGPGAVALAAMVDDYAEVVAPSGDPYMRAVWVVAMRVDVVGAAAGDGGGGGGGKGGGGAPAVALPDEEYALLFYSVEDYLWMRTAGCARDAVHLAVTGAPHGLVAASSAGAELRGGGGGGSGGGGYAALTASYASTVASPTSAAPYP
ncbi:hypothetical protein I4F81_000717 [Pyropia yezoensis]|uniref:Uncharacterized protein n=1 Tax=Pyropia yezoensis TaxID=2788 RepID=A0ACC3BJG7_PYRYE|nr:hypothetical protein I4F81_000717 [Neopyropia yezoensis]